MMVVELSSLRSVELMPAVLCWLLTGDYPQFLPTWASPNNERGSANKTSHYLCHLIMKMTLLSVARFYWLEASYSWGGNCTRFPHRMPTTVFSGIQLKALRSMFVEKRCSHKPNSGEQELSGGRKSEATVSTRMEHHSAFIL